MLYGKQMRGSLVLFATLMVPSCGAESPSTPTGQYYQTTSTLTTPGFNGMPTTCHQFNNAKAGQVGVSVTPQSIHLALGAGMCNAPGQILAEKDTELVVNAPAGWHHVRLSNPNPSGETPYTIQLTYWRSF